MRCSKCSSENREGRKFCTTCGTPLFAAACAKCGAPVQADEIFCGDCGARIILGFQPVNTSQSSRAVRITSQPTETTANEGERKTITALFADIKGSTELMAELDPEEARRIIDPALNLMIEAVRGYDGYIVQSTGDGIFALFGAPLAHEDHPQRALYAALRIHEELRCYSGTVMAYGRNPIQCRVGANTGEVVVRSISTGEGHSEYTPIGHAINLAARMQAAAPVGSIAVSDITRQWCEGYFAFRSLGPTRLRGLPSTLEVHEVTGLGPLRTRLQRAVVSGLTKFVGRDRDIETLKRALEQAVNGHGQIVATIAEAGVGKSRMLHEFRAALQSECKVLDGFAVSYGKTSAFLPVVDVLRNYFRIGNDNDEHTRREKVIGTILRLDPALQDTVPYLFTVLGIVGREDPMAQMDAQVKKRRTLEAIKRILLRESVNQTLIVIFEDLHWIDEQTQEFLNLLVDSIGTARILLLVSYRPEYQHQWGQKSYYTQLRLDPLVKETAIEMLTVLLGPGTELAPLKQLIIDRTQGNPFFIEEIVHALFEEGSLARNGEVKLRRAFHEIRIPAAVQAILSARIDRLPQSKKVLLQTLAVLGNEFTLNVVSSTLTEPETELEQRLSELQSAEFIYERAAASEKKYTFKHALTQEAAYNSILVERRRQIHERAAEALEQLYAGRQSEIVDELARHYLKSGNVSKAIEYLQYAAELALARSFFSDAADKLTSALELVAQLPEETQSRQELALQLRLGTANLGFLGFASEGREKAIRRAMELCRRSEGDRETFPVIANLCQLNIQRAELRAARELAHRELDLAERFREPAFILVAHNDLGEICSLEGALRGSLEHLEHASRVYDARVNAELMPLYSIDFLVPITTVAAMVECLLGWPDRSVRRSQAAQKHVEALSPHSFSRAFLATALSWASVVRRDAHCIREATEGIIPVDTECGFSHLLAWAKCYHGWSLIEQSRPSEGIREMDEGLALLDNMQDRYSRTMFFAMLAEGHEKLGEDKRAMELIDDALERANQTGERFYEPELHRLKGELHRKTAPAEPERAENFFRTAISIARSQEAKLWELRTTTSLARLLRDTGRCNEARTTLSDVYGWFTEGFDTADLKDAKALLDELSA